MFESIEKDGVSLSIRNGLYLPFIYKGHQVVVHNAAWTPREKIWVDDELVVNELGFSMQSTHAVDVAGDRLDVSFGYRNYMREVFLEAKLGAETVHEVSQRIATEIKPTAIVMVLLGSGLLGLAVGYLFGAMLGGS